MTQKYALLNLLLSANLVLSGHLMPGGIIDMAKYRDQILESHNSYRNIIARRGLNDGSTSTKATDMQEMTYDLELENSALQHAKTCQFTNNGQNAAKNSAQKPYQYGQNLYIKMTPSARRLRTSTINVKNALNTWFKEYANFEYGEYNENSCGEGNDCGHFTRMVWAKTNKVGCAITKCGFDKNEINELKSGEVIICHYYPKGALLGEKPWAVREGEDSEFIAEEPTTEEPCSNSNKNYESLCVPKENSKKDICILENGCSEKGTSSCTAGKHFFTCKCKDGFIGDKCELETAVGEKKSTDRVTLNLRAFRPESPEITSTTEQDENDVILTKDFNFHGQKPASYKKNIKVLLNSINSRKSNEAAVNILKRTKMPNGMLSVAIDDDHNKKCLSIQNCPKSRIACKAKLIDCDRQKDVTDQEENSIIKHRHDNTIYSVHYDRCLQMGERSILFKKCTNTPDQKFKFKNGILSNMSGSNCVAVNALAKNQNNWAKIVACSKLPASQVKETGMKFYSKIELGQKGGRQDFSRVADVSLDDINQNQHSSSSNKKIINFDHQRSNFNGRIKFSLPDSTGQNNVSENESDDNKGINTKLAKELLNQGDDDSNIINYNVDKGMEQQREEAADHSFRIGTDSTDSVRF